MFNKPTAQALTLALMLLAPTPCSATNASPPRENTSAPASVAIDSLVSLSGYSLHDISNWSPVGAKLALSSGSGTSILDAASANLNPTLATHWYGQVIWAPDATWLTVRVQSWPRPVMLVAVPVEGGKPQTLTQGDRVLPCIWASDGNLYYWTGETDAPELVPPPEGWLSRPRPSIPPRPQVVMEARGQGVTRFWRVDPSAEPAVQAVPALDSLAGSNWALIMDQSADGRRLLVHGPGTYSHSGSSLIMNERGALLDSLGWAVHWRSLCSDGEHVVGMVTTDDGHSILSSSLYLGDIHGHWRIEIPGTEGALNPCMSREGWFIAYLQDGQVKVGTLRIQHR